MQVTAKKQTVSAVQNTEKQQDVELVMRRVQEMKAREDHQRQLRIETLKKNAEFNLQPKTSVTEERDEQATDGSGLQRLFLQHNAMKIARAKQMQEAACLHKEMIVQRKEQKKSAIETEKILDLYASKCNDQLLEKSINDYQSMIT